MIPSSQNQIEPVVVLGLTLNGATVLRRLLHLGYAAWGLSFNRSEPGWHVAGAALHETPDPRDDFDGWVDSLLEVARHFDDLPPILPMSDVHVVALDRAAPRLEGHYRMHGFGDGLRTSLTSKRGTFDWATERRSSSR